MTQQRPKDLEAEAKARGVVKRVRGRPQGAKDKRRRRRRARAPPPDDPDAFSINEFCRQHMISRMTYERLRAAGRGPAEMKLFQRVLISTEAAVAWRQRMEAETKAAREVAE